MQFLRLRLDDLELSFTLIMLVPNPIQPNIQIIILPTDLNKPLPHNLQLLIQDLQTLLTIHTLLPQLILDLLPHPLTFLPDPIELPLKPHPLLLQHPKVLFQPLILLHQGLIPTLHIFKVECVNNIR